MAGAITIQLAFLRGHSWAAEARTEQTDSTITLMRLLDRLWRDRPEPRCQILQVGLVLTRLCEHGNYTPQLFQVVTDTMAAQDKEKHQRLDATLDKLRARCGRKVITASKRKHEHACDQSYKALRVKTEEPKVQRFKSSSRNQ